MAKKATKRDEIENEVDINMSSTIATERSEAGTSCVPPAKATFDAKTTAATVGELDLGSGSFDAWVDFAQASTRSNRHTLKPGTEDRLAARS